MNSWCSRWALLTSATVGAAQSANCDISPGWFMPNSNTAMRWWARKRNRVSGTPIWLLKLPWVANALADCHTCTIEASICVTVVLPLLPVTAINGTANCARHALAKVCRAQSVSSTSMPAKPAAAKPWRAIATLTPAADKPGKKSWPSNVSPCKATNTSLA